MSQTCRFILIVAFVASILAGCSFANRTREGALLSHPSELESGSRGAGFADLIPYLFPGRYDKNYGQERKMLERIMESLEREDESMENLFSANTINSCKSLGEQITLLNQFFCGEIDSVTNKGVISHESTDHGTVTEIIQASYDISTTSDVYRIAFQFCLADTINPDNVGLQSLYIIKAEDSDKDFSYWGGHKWEAGIFIEGNSELELVEK